MNRQNKIQKIAVVLLTLAISYVWLTPGAAEVIPLKSGRNIEGTIIEKTQNYIKIKTGKGAFNIDFSHIQKEKAKEIKKNMEDFQEDVQKSPQEDLHNYIAEATTIPSSEDRYLNENIEKENFETKIYQLFYQNKYQEIERIADELRLNKPRLLSGRWKIDFLYSGINQEMKEADLQQMLFHVRRLEDWVNREPRSITPKIALIDAYADLAWKYRGGGYSSDVTDKEREGFKNVLTKAVSVIEEAEALNAGDPTLYAGSLKIRVGLGHSQINWMNLLSGQADDRFTELYDIVQKSVDLDPEYQSTYLNMTWALLRQWYGAPGELEEFADWAVKQTKEKEGEGMYARIAIRAKYYEGYDDNYNFSWERLQQGFIDLRERFPDSFSILNNYAWFASHHKDLALSQKLFEEIGDRWDKESVHVWHGKRVFKKYQQWVRTGENYPEKTGKLVNGLRDGLFTYYFDTGDIKSEYNYKNGVRHGFIRTYYKNGNPKMEWNYVNGKKQGETKEFNEYGDVTGTWVYKNNKVVNYR